MTRGSRNGSGALHSLYPLVFLGFAAGCGSLNTGEVIVDSTSAGGSAGAADEDAVTGATDTGGATSGGLQHLDESSSAGGTGNNDDSSDSGGNGGTTASVGGNSGSGGDSSNGGAGGSVTSGTSSTDATPTSTTGSACAEACSGGQTCHEGSCECPGDEPDWCDGSCTDVLTDTENCGRCGHSCHDGTCSDGRCDAITLASGRTAPWELAVNEDGVYWLEADAVMAAALDGSAVVTLADEGAVGGPTSIAASPTTVYYTNQWSDMICTCFERRVMEVPTAGGGDPLAFTEPDYSNARPMGVTYSDGVIYWYDHGPEILYGADEDMGDEPEIVYGNIIYPLGYDLAVDATNVYWGDANSVMYKHALSGGDVVVLNALESGAPPTFAIAVGGGYVYWTTGTPTTPQATTPKNSSVFKVSIDGGTAVKVKSSLAVTPALAADATGVYWSDGNINRTSHDGKVVDKLVEGENAGFIALDDDFVYWTDATSGKVMKVAK